MAVDRVDVQRQHPQIFCVVPSFESAFLFYNLVTKIAQFTGITAGIVSQENQSNRILF